MYGILYSVSLRFTAGVVVVFVVVKMALKGGSCRCFEVRV